MADAYSFFKNTIQKQAPVAEKGGIRVDCYLAVLPKFKVLNPKAHFEDVTATAKSPLSPTWTLLKRFQARQKASGVQFNPAIFAAYLQELEPQLRSSRAAMERLAYLAGLVRQGITVFLVCYEVKPEECHRTLVKRMIEEML
jgi:hypothetical protein